MEYIQEIIVFSIIALALIFTGYRVMRKFTSSSGGCDGCSSDCSGCSVMDLKKQIEENKNKKPLSDSTLLKHRPLKSVK